jgi:hypothetical protein
MIGPWTVIIMVSVRILGSILKQNKGGVTYSKAIAVELLLCTLLTSVPYLF